MTDDQIRKFAEFLHTSAIVMLRVQHREGDRTGPMQMRLNGMSVAGSVLLGVAPAELLARIHLYLDHSGVREADEPWAMKPDTDLAQTYAHDLGL